MVELPESYPVLFGNFYLEWWRKSRKKNIAKWAFKCLAEENQPIPNDLAGEISPMLRAAEIKPTEGLQQALEVSPIPIDTTNDIVSDHNQ
jgi:hypothetical protein